MSKRIMMLGAGLMQGPAIRLAHERGWQVVAVDGNEKAVCAPMADVFYKIDLKDKDALLDCARSLKNDGGLDGVLTAGTDFSASVAWVAEHLALPGIPHEVALDASDKERMRTRFRAAGVPSPEFIVLREPPHAEANLPFAFPAVVKPVDNMGGRGCRRVDDQASLSEAVADALRYSRSGRAIVEEYMDGPEFSVDSLVFDGEITFCGLADRHIHYPPYFIEMGHTIPTDLDAERQRELLAVFARGVRALGIRNGAAKGDVKFTSRGPMIGEIAARLSGGFMSGWTWPYASGVEPTSGALSIAVGEAPGDLSPKRDWTCAERAFISIPGRVRATVGFAEAAGVPFVRDFLPRVERGSEVVFPVNNVTKCGNVIAAAPTREEACAAAERACRAVLLPLECPNAATAAFLALSPSLENAFPPDAYRLDAAGLGALSRLPSCTAVRGDLAPGASITLVPFTELENSGLHDYAGRDVEEGLAACFSLAGISAHVGSADGRGVLGREFWTAFVRGGYQGALYYLDSLRG